MAEGLPLSSAFLSSDETIEDVSLMLSEDSGDEICDLMLKCLHSEVEVDGSARDRRPSILLDTSDGPDRSRCRRGRKRSRGRDLGQASDSDEFHTGRRRPRSSALPGPRGTHFSFPTQGLPSPPRSIPRSFANLGLNVGRPCGLGLGQDSDSEDEFLPQRPPRRRRRKRPRFSVLPIPRGTDSSSSTKESPSSPR